MWKAIPQRIVSKIRLRFIGRFNKVLTITRRSKQFYPFAVGMNFYEGFLNKEQSSNALKNHINLKAQIINQAEEILGHRFDLLGSGEVVLDKRIDWASDFKIGHRWPLKYFHHLETELYSREANLPKGADIKVPWELSRLQHFVVLGQAYWLSGDERFSQEFLAETVSWMEDNPPEMGVNWVCSMDVSLRAVSLILAYFYFKSSPRVSKEFWDRYFTLLYYSGVHIEQNQEVSYSGHGNNHYLINCAALVWLGLFFGRYNRRTKRWLKNGLANLCRQMDYQVNSDGGSFEGSIAYHRLALETFLYTTILAEKNDLNFPEQYYARLEKMCEFSRHSFKPNGLAPQFGDADNGRFCILSGYQTEDFRDHRSLLGVAGEYFQRYDFQEVAGEKWLDCFWLYGRSSQLKKTLTPYPELVSYPETGFYIIRNDLLFFMVKCGRIGQKNHGGHDHNDQLSFELSIQGVDLIIDPGCYGYTLDKDSRHLFRSTQYHNVSQIADLEINKIKKVTTQDLFSMGSSNPGLCLFFEQVAKGSIRFSGNITLAETEIQYLRSVELDPSGKFLEIIDVFTGTEQEATCRLHLANDVQALQLSETKVEIWSGAVRATIEAEALLRIEVGWVSPSYGVRLDSLILSWTFFHKTKFRIYL